MFFNNCSIFKELSLLSAATNIILSFFYPSVNNQFLGRLREIILLAVFGGQQLS